MSPSKERSITNFVKLGPLGDYVINIAKVHRALFCPIWMAVLVTFSSPRFSLGTLVIRKEKNNF